MRQKIQQPTKKRKRLSHVLGNFHRILNEVGDVKFGQFLSLGIGSTLAFCIDDTGSMSGEIAAAKKRAQVNQRNTLKVFTLNECEVDLLLTLKIGDR